MLMMSYFLGIDDAYCLHCEPNPNNLHELGNKKKDLAPATEAEIWYKHSGRQSFKDVDPHCNQSEHCSWLCNLGHPASARSHAVTNVLIIILIGQQSPPSLFLSFIHLRVRRLLATMDYGYLDELGQRAR